MLKALSPLDGRYSKKTSSLTDYFSEYALIKYRVYIEIEYFKALAPYSGVDSSQFKALDDITNNFSLQDAQQIKDTESITNHDVKAVEYFVKSKLKELQLEEWEEFVHFGLTSQDINNTAVPLSLKDALDQVIYPLIDKLISVLTALAKKYLGIPMLARTHGQAASPTSVGKEIEVFVERLNDQLALAKSAPIKAKFGGATGNLNAHKVSYPEVNWIDFANDFVENLGLVRSQKTTQIAHYDHLAAIFDAWARINTILKDLCQDFWIYISQEYFKQKTVANEVGSSAMPHKVNPIDFENAEGNLGIANAIFHHLSTKLPISRLQRDLTDSTVLRNIGVPFGHMLVAYTSLLKGLSKIDLNPAKLEEDLEDNWAVVAEAIQNILRREKFEKPYEMLKELTRGKETINRETIVSFIESLSLSEGLKQELLEISPHNYIGYYE